MKLHELSPVAGSTQVGKRKGRGTGSGNGKTGGRGQATRVRRPAPAARFAWDLKAARCLWHVVSPSAVSTTSTRSR